MRNLLTKPCAIALAVASGFSQHAFANEAEIARTANTTPTANEQTEEPEKIESFEEELDEFEKPKRNFLVDLIKFLTPTRKVKEEEILDISEEAVSEQIETESKEDMKLLAKTLLGMLENISPDEVNRLKNTKEFSTFKEVLKKYNVIK